VTVLARKLSVLAFALILLAYTLFPGAEVVRQTAASAQSGTVAPAAAQDEAETVDFGADQDASSAPADVQNTPAVQDAAATTNDVVVRYTEAAATAEVTAEPTPTPVPTPEPTPMATGMSGPAVAELQQKLVTWGFLSQKADGVFGIATEDAVGDLQAYLSMLASGVEPAASVTIGDDSSYSDGTVEALSGSSGETPEPSPSPSPSPTPAPAYPSTGIVDGKLMQAIADGFPVYRETIMSGSSGLDTERVQRRLESMGYLYKGDDGVFGEKTQEGLTYFQKVNGIPETGIADEVTQKLLFSENAVESDKPYHPYFIKVDISEQRLYIYTWNENKQDYSTLVKKVKCSTGAKGTPTPTGTFQDTTGPGKRWHHFSDYACWAQYAFYIKGDIMIHSVLYTKKGGSPTFGSVHNLGRRASHGCVRVAVKDAKWVWENCGVGTTIVIQK
jgi:peptidoglycan hydrolase-like protein with peptidoglycan-binding domain